MRTSFPIRLIPSSAIASLIQRQGVQRVGGRNLGDLITVSMRRPRLLIGSVTIAIASLQGRLSVLSNPLRTLGPGKSLRANDLHHPHRSIANACFSCMNA